MTEARPQFNLVLIVHAHQPAGNFEHVFEECYQTSYDVFLAMVEKHPGVRLGLHYSGPLLLWIEKNHPEYFARLRRLVATGQVELIGGGFYEPILISIPTADQVEQLTRLARYIENHFGKRPTGAWLAERVWEPQLPASLAGANVAYTLVDDLPFIAAGFEPEELYGAYIAEDRGKTVWVFPGLKDLRYLIPFRKPGETIAYLEKAASLHPGGAAAFGDDMEKFGCWPGTFKHCYADGWLEDFFSALEENSSWLKTVTPGEFMATHHPLGPRRSAQCFLCRNDGMGVAHAPAGTILFAGEGICRAAGGADVFARWRMARLFPQISGVQSAAQENAASLGGGRFDTSAAHQRGVRRAKSGSARSRFAGAGK